MGLFCGDEDWGFAGMIRRILSIFTRNEQTQIFSNADDFIDHIADLVRNDEADMAFQHLSIFQKKNPHNCKELCNSASHISRGGRPDLAIEILSTAVKQNAGDTALIGNLAAAYLNDSQPTQALELVEQAIQIDPDNPNACKLNSSILQNLHRYEEAIALCSSYLDRFPKEPLLWLSLGMCKMACRNCLEAATCFRTAHKLNPDDFRSFANIAAALIGAKEFDEAEGVVLIALEKNSDDGMSICNLGLIYENREMHNEALELYKKSIEVDPMYTRAQSEIDRLTQFLEIT